MTNKQSTKRALLVSLMAMLLCFAMMLGTTYAWFTDKVENTGNKIQAGTLDVELYLWTDADTKEAISARTEPIFGVNSLVAQNDAADTLWEPGKTQVVYLSIKNNGNLALKYKVDLLVSEITKNLNEVVTYTITRDAKFGDPINGTAQSVVAGVNTTEATSVELAPGAENFFALSVHMDENAGNDYQAGTITFDMAVYATQLNAEADSNGTNYDAGAEFPG